MDTRTNILYKDEETAIKAGAKKDDLSTIPGKLKRDALKALDGKDSVKIPKNSVSALSQWAQKERNAKKRKKKRNRTAGQSRKKNRR